MRPITRGAAVIALTGACAAGPVIAQEMPLPPRSGSGLTVTPAYEGWYELPDGTIAMSFGYFNRNMEEVIEVPLGDANAISEPGLDGDQPEHFAPGRHFGVFAIRVPSDFDPEQRVYWTLTVRGETQRVPGHLHPDWKIDAIVGEAGSGNKPPTVWFDEGGPEAMGPAGVVGKTRTASADEPLELTVHARDDGRSRTSVRGSGDTAVPVTVTWFKHRGPGDVWFGEPTAEIPAAGGSATTTVMFGAPGEYVLRVRANDASGVSTAGHAQCCWTNGFVKVTVTP
ncbi:MAG: hypothetical protein R3195_00060 [Gemmatimonadota bacterium]|nr:hypothetical protein [Gemmatimonadota bacterium]